MFRITTAALLLVLISGQVQPLGAQDRKLTMGEAITGYHLYPKRLNQLMWVDNNHFSHVSADGKELYISQVEETLNGVVSTVLFQDVDSFFRMQFDTSTNLKRFGRIHSWASKYVFRIVINNDLYAFHYGDKRFSRVIGDFNQTNGDYHELTNQLAYTDKSDLYIRAGETVKRVTADGGMGIVNGEAVHRYEFGISKGTFWSPSGVRLAFYRMDESMVTEYPLYVLSDTPATSKMVRYPVAGAKSHHVQVGVYDVATGKTIFLNTGEPGEQYLTNITWGPDGKYLYVALVNREQNHMWLRSYDASTGELVRTLFEETHDKYVEPEHGPVFLKTDKNKFLWWSERDGYNHLYLYSTDGTLIRQVTSGRWVVTEINGWSEDEADLFITATRESAIERHLYCVNVMSGRIRKVTKEEGSHLIQMNGSATHYLDQFSSTDVPGAVYLNESEGKLLGVLHTADDPLSEYASGKMEIGTLKADDNTPLYYRIFYPVDFDPDKKYPVVVYLYNGPHLQLIRNTWMGGANLWYQYMAQNGFIVFSIDGRGSAYRGLEFENAIFRNLGDLEMKDQLTGVNWLKSKPWVDSTRMGVHGWSYGGFMTTSLMTRYPGVFKAGVAGGPVIDWQFYEIMYTERYMDSPQENPEGYKKANLIQYVDQLEGKLLMIHGGQDATVLWQHSLLYLNAAISKKVQLGYFVYPDHEHNVFGMDRVHLYQMITDFLVEELE